MMSTRYQPVDNGAGPMWTAGNTCIVRVGDQVLASGLETLPDYKPLNNVRWTLFKAATRAGAAGARRRHPRARALPLVAFPDGRVLLSTNPNDLSRTNTTARATPQILQFSAWNPCSRLRRCCHRDREIRFHGHTYRSFAADGRRGELILFYNTAYDMAYWSATRGAVGLAGRTRVPLRRRVRRAAADPRLLTPTSR